MILFNKKIIATKHCKERIRERRIEHGEHIYKNATDKEVRNFVLRLLDTKMVKKQKIEETEDGEKIRKIWTKGSQLLICKETEKTMIVITYIACMPQDMERLMGTPYSKKDFWDEAKFW